MRGRVTAAIDRVDSNSKISALQSFWTKFQHDWCMNLAGLLAYNFLTAILPLLLGILALAAFVLPDPLIHQLADQISLALPEQGKSLGINFYEVLNSIHKGSGVAVILSLAGLIWTGSNLFGVMENCFSIIYRTGTRSFLTQKLMSFVMVLVFAILAPLSVLASSIGGALDALQGVTRALPGSALLLVLVSYVSGLVIAFVLFFAIYWIVPLVRVGPNQVWLGALVAAILFVAINIAFPLYLSHIQSPFGKAALIIATFTFWSWIVSLILLIGAEVNAFYLLRNQPTSKDLAGTIADAAVEQRIAERSGSLMAGDRRGASSLSASRVGRPAAIALVAVATALLAVHRVAGGRG